MAGAAGGGDPLFYDSLKVIFRRRAIEPSYFYDNNAIYGSKRFREGIDPSSFHDETMAHAITPNDRTDVEALVCAAAVANLRQRPAALRTVAAFLTIATNEGRALNDYARALKIHRAYMSKMVHDLCDLARNGGQGLGLIGDSRREEGKRLEISVTDRGRAIAEAMRCQQMLLALRPFSKMPPITVRTVTVLLIIAANEGKSPADIARLLKFNCGIMSKTFMV